MVGKLHIINNKWNNNLFFILINTFKKILMKISISFYLIICFIKFKPYEFTGMIFFILAGFMEYVIVINYIYIY